MQTLNPAQLVKDLDSLIPKNATVTANDAGSAVIMTAPQRDVRRISEIISALDSSSVSDVEVFVLKYDRRQICRRRIEGDLPKRRLERHRCRHAK